MKKKPHAAYDCPCTNCQKWNRVEIARLRARVNALIGLCKTMLGVLHDYEVPGDYKLIDELAAKIGDIEATE